jgi:PAS domain S-box-containing protein
VVIGAVGGAIAVFGRDLMERLKIDDAIDAVPVHLGGGIWGTLALGLFGLPNSSELNFDRVEFFLVQLIGVIVSGLWAFGLSFSILWVLNKLFVLRVTNEEEQIGLNVSEHRATTEIYQLFNIMESQARDPSQRLRVPVEPFTEAGQIAGRYNQVMDALEEAVTRNTAIVTTARDAIITFESDSYAILTANPSAFKIFGYDSTEILLAGISILDLLGGDRGKREEMLFTVLDAGRGDLTGRRLDGSEFPLAAAVTLTKTGRQAFFTATLRDISDRKAAEAALAQAYREISGLNQRLKAENVRLGAEIDVSRRLQAMLLPKPQELREISDLDIAGFMDPAAEVGGDYYDVLVRGDRVQFGIGDVTGHGLESGVLTIMVQTAVRTLLEHNEADLKCFIDTINRTIYGNVQRMDSDKNITLSLLDYEDGMLTLCGQHEEVLVARYQGELERVDTIDLGFPVGLEADISDFTRKMQIPLGNGDVALLFTDGITEAEDEQGQFYGIDRLCETLERVKANPANAICQLIVDDVRQHIGRQIVHDDITLLVIKRRQSDREFDR